MGGGGDHAREPLRLDTLLGQPNGTAKKRYLARLGLRRRGAPPLYLT
jgi:hypothetical protein